MKDNGLKQKRVDMKKKKLERLKWKWYKKKFEKMNNSQFTKFLVYCRVAKLMAKRKCPHITFRTEI